MVQFFLQVREFPRAVSALHARCPDAGERVVFERAKCAKDEQLRTVTALHSYSGEEELGSRRLDTLGLPLFDLFTARSGDREIAYIPYRDAPLVLGALASGLADPRP